MSFEVSEPIKVADVDFHVTKSIDQCPPGLQQRELIRNGVEAEFTPEEDGTRRILIRAIDVQGVPKLSIFNTGRGMSASELKAATDLASSIRKEQGLGGRLNRGEGAKVASLPWNPHGLRFRSCQDGKVSESIVKKHDGRYVRVRELVIDELGSETYDSVWDVTDEARAEEYPTSHDWTEVVCLGRDAQHDTTRFPYGEGGGGKRREILSEIFGRFYSLPHWVSLEADESLHGRKGAKSFRLMADVISKWSADREKLRCERRAATDGVEIEYVYLPTLSGSNNVIGGYELAGQSPRIAIVWRGEMYDAKVGSEWAKIAAGFGLPYIHTAMCVFIHIADDAPVQEGPYRVDLHWLEDGERVEVEEFQSVVRSQMPEWVRDLVESALRPRRASDMTQVEEELERRLKKALISTPPHAEFGLHPSASPVGQSSVTRLVDVANPDGSGDRDVDRGPETEVTILDPDAEQAPRGGGERRSPTLGGTIKRRRAVQLVSTAPKIRWIDDEKLVESENLIERAAKYVESTNELYINALYPAVNGKVVELEKFYKGRVDWESVRELVSEKVRVAMALHVGSVVVHALAKQKNKSWSDEDRKIALSSVSLTVAADQSDHLSGEIRTVLSKVSEFRAAQTAE